MATAIFGPRGVIVARDLLKAPNNGLNKIRGGGSLTTDEYTLDWEDYTYGLRTTNRMLTENALIFQYPVTGTIGNIVLSDSLTGTKALTLVLQTGARQSDTIKFLREIVIKLFE
jgi:hypothetical protein